MPVTGARTAPQRIAIAAAVIVTLALIGAGAVSVASGAVVQSRDTSHTVVGAVSSVHVAVDGGIQVAPGPDGQVTVASHQVWSFQQPTIQETQVGADLTIAASCPPVTWGTCTTSLRLSVPIGAALDLSSQNSNVSVSGVHGDLTLHSSNGDVVVAEASGPLHLSSDNGHVTGTGLTSAVAQASSGNGDVDLTFDNVPTTVTGSSSNGNVVVGLARGPAAYLVVATTDNGNRSVVVHTDSASVHHIVASSHNGDVSVDYAP
jgi:hypothetical protein